jgi:hypothetical protein
MIVRKAHGPGALASSVSDVVAVRTSAFSSGSNHFDDGPALKLLWKTASRVVLRNLRVEQVDRRSGTLGAFLLDRANGAYASSKNGGSA